MNLWAKEDKNAEKLPESAIIHGPLVTKRAGVLS